MREHRVRVRFCADRQAFDTIPAEGPRVMDVWIDYWADCRVIPNKSDEVVVKGERCVVADRRLHHWVMNSIHTVEYVDCYIIPL